MSQSQFAYRYSGGRAFASPQFPGGQHGPGTCKRCGQASAQCCCGCRECRKESKELLFTPSATTGRTGAVGGANLSANDSPMLKAMAASANDTLATAFIGGGCCVHLSIEYTQVSPTVESIVLVGVVDSEGTTLIWEKKDPPGTHYQVKECIITTKPGATLRLLAVNATARVRWCETFSC